MTELVTTEQVESVLGVLIWAGPLAGALVGIIVGSMRKCPLRGLWQGVAVGLLGPIINALWLLHSSMMRYDPQTGVAGLHRVSAHVISALIFIAIGLLLGVIYRHGVFPERKAEAEQAPDEAPDKVSDQQ